MGPDEYEEMRAQFQHERETQRRPWSLGPNEDYPNMFDIRLMVAPNMGTVLTVNKFELDDLINVIEGRPVVGSRWREKTNPSRVVEVLPVKRKDLVLIQTMTVANKRKQSYPSWVSLRSFHKRFEEAV